MQVGVPEWFLKVDLSRPDTLPKGRIDARVLDAATEQDLAFQQVMDDAEAMADAARFARRVRKRLGLTQAEFSRRIEVPLDTIRNWEQESAARRARRRRSCECSTRRRNRH